MQVETPEVGAEKATTHIFKQGDKVTFTEVRRGAKSIRFSAKEATVVRILGSTAIVKYRNGHNVAILISELTPAGERNALTRALLGEASV
ncbi:hypothetical protein K3F44_18235 [Pseudomonas sp. S07E 245]|uniref:hypothetical protein n=1 Tax=Pseudomonas sp. S07E 245 TaxID=2866278 RepID=UPI001C72C6B5|nr:hypothetical protein [Pseudomonas sp. S07E 245]QYX51530.1 hypothetical protein K3F44_18235 [Pseudomonas sp. S07E 245]